MLIEQLVLNPYIEKIDAKHITASYGNYRIKLSDRQIRYFKTLDDADSFLSMYLKNVIDS
jgi:hypothetical protein